MKKILISIILAVFSVTALAQDKTEKIEGAFGLKLGDTFDIKTLGAKAIPSSGGSLMYNFTPTNPMRSFTRYGVVLTPKTHRIAGITAMGDYDDKAGAQKEQAVVLALLTKKYGAQDKAQIEDQLDSNKRIVQGKRMIMMFIDAGVNKARLTISYADETLFNLAEKERIELESRKLDSSGL